jgi:hypothetical protein
MIYKNEIILVVVVLYQMAEVIPAIVEPIIAIGHE